MATVSATPSFTISSTVLIGVQLRVLRQVTDGISGREHHVALVFLFDTGDYFEKGGFAGSVKTEYAYFSSVEKN